MLCRRSICRLSANAANVWSRQKVATTRRELSVSTRHLNDTVGFIGLGNMGNHMARNLISKGHKLVVCDVSQVATDGLKAAGIHKKHLRRGLKAAGNSEVAAPGCQVDNCHYAVPGAPRAIVRSCLYRSKGNSFRHMAASMPVQKHMSIIPETSCEVFGVIDFMRSGSFCVNAARDAILTFMVGSPEESFENAKELLDCMGKNVVHCGAVGTGQAAKICNNMLLAVSMIGTSEAMNLGTRLGLDPKMLAKILNMSSGRCWSSELYNPYPGVLEGVPSSNNYQGGFGTALMTKDLGLAQRAATGTKSAIPLGGLAHQIYRTMTNNGYATKDFSSALKFLQGEEQS
ncbi:LOW QUALITY PROTEIN: 3-hydroxyisobutyrate dehydrogenase, mitochondrial-like [Argopecten irradians]|uniref:LOW QUALITY PROTEIN: 3-hydroxyisobutyrate dehydrogenase, mitochondrial-like n=1 Tax=Argopecten irradians TaxID=31199 RepID=UPI0037154D02